MKPRPPGRIGRSRRSARLSSTQHPAGEGSRFRLPPAAVENRANHRPQQALAGALLGVGAAAALVIGLVELLGHTYDALEEMGEL